MNDTIDYIDKDEFKYELLNAITKVKALFDCNDIVLVTGSKLLKNLNKLYGYEIIHIDMIKNKNEEKFNDKIFIIPSYSIKVKFTDFK